MDDKIFTMKLEKLALEATPAQMGVAVKFFREIQGIKAVDGLVVGDLVRFDAKTRGIVAGKITKINRKTVKVLTVKGVKWSVAPSLLQKVS